MEYVDNTKSRLGLYQLTGTPKRTEQNVFVRIGKSEAKVTNVRLIMLSMYSTVEALCSEKTPTYVFLHNS